MMRKTAAAAAAVAIFVLLPNTSGQVAYAMSNIPIVGGLVKAVTFRDYQYEEERYYADIKVQGIAVEGGASDAQESLKKTTEEINAEIQKITDEYVKNFKEDLEQGEGNQDVIVKSEVINTLENYFTLKLHCYQGAGSGFEQNYYYTIDLNTGKRLRLADLFTENADYVTAISGNIKKQMAEQMAEDEDKLYWLNYAEVPTLNFDKITDETEFYINEAGNIVISFDDGEVAPMYMGSVEFVIPMEVTEGMWK